MSAANGGEGNRRPFRLVSVMWRADDLTRGAAGRLAAELTPFSAWAGMVSWSEATASTAVAATTGRFTHRVSTRIDGDGRLIDLASLWWANTDDKRFREEAFEAIFSAETRFEEYVLPSSFTARWWARSDRRNEGEFFRCTTDHASFF